METELAEEQITDVDLRTNTIGNNMGFSLVNQLQEVLEEVKELKENQKRTDKVLKRELWGSDFVIVRAATLDEWAANRQADFDGNRNALVHGGSTARGY